MSRTTKKGLGASLMPAFDLMPESKLIKAAAAIEESKDSIPIFVKPDRGHPILLVPGDDRKVRAYDIKPGPRARLPKPPFDTVQLIGNSRFKLVAIDTRVVKVRGKSLRISDGVLQNSLVSLNVSPMRWGEMPPHQPHRPLRPTTRPRPRAR